MFYDEDTNKKYPGSYILINNKYEIGYIKILEAFKRLLTLENTININIKSITSDFENSLVNAIKHIFPKIRHVGCLFHYVQALRRNLGKYGLLTKDFNHLDFLKELSSIPFLYNKDIDIINNIFNRYIKLYKKEVTITELLYKFQKYFKNTWNIYFENGSLNYINLKKYERSNSYIENYNKRIKDNLGKLKFI